MKVPELFYHLEYFTEEDYKLFAKYLKSPYYNSFKAHSEIFCIICKNKKFISLKYYKELRELIISGLSCSEKTTLKLLSNLSELVLKYLKLRAIERNPLNGEYLFCDYLLSKGYYKIIQDRISRCWEMLNKDENIDENTFLDYFRIDYLNFKISVMTESKYFGDEAIKDQQEYIIDSSKNLFVYTLARLTINYLNYIILNIDSSIKNSNPYPVILSPMFDIINTNEFNTYNIKQKSLINLYYRLYLMFHDLNDDNAYKNYKNMFLKVRKLFNLDFTKTHYSILLNYCYLRHRLSDKDLKYNDEGAKLLFKYIQEGMYKDDKDKYLLPALYRNFVITCNTVTTKILLKDFIDGYSDKLHPSHYNEMSNFGYAHYYYLNKEYGKALKYMNELKNPHTLYRYDIRNLELKIYYEKGNYEGLESVLHNYHENIKRENLFTENDKSSYTLQVYYFKKLINIGEKYKVQRDINEFECLMNNIMSKPNFVMKKWIISKINNIIDNHYILKKLE